MHIIKHNQLPSKPTYQALIFHRAFPGFGAIRETQPTVELHTFESAGELETFYNDHVSSPPFLPIVCQYGQAYDVGDPPFEDPNHEH